MLVAVHKHTPNASKYTRSHHSLPEPPGSSGGLPGGSIPPIGQQGQPISHQGRPSTCSSAAAAPPWPLALSARSSLEPLEETQPSSKHDDRSRILGRDAEQIPPSLPAAKEVVRAHGWARSRLTASASFFSRRRAATPSACWAGDGAAETPAAPAGRGGVGGGVGGARRRRARMLVAVMRRMSSSPTPATQRRVGVSDATQRGRSSASGRALTPLPQCRDRVLRDNAAESPLPPGTAAACDLPAGRR